MNDLIDVREALGEPEPPSQAARAAARTAVMQAAARVSRSGQPASRAPGVRRWRTGRLAGGLGVIAAAAAAIAVIMAAGIPGGSVRGGQGNAHPRATSHLSGRQILLDAATAAAAAPVRTGRYWYVDELAPRSVSTASTQGWYTHDGTLYGWIPQDNGVYLASPHAGFSVGASSLTYQQIERLPASPAALTAWIIRSYAHPSGPLTGRVPRAADGGGPRAATPSAVAISLSELLDQIPAPAAVRAAAFRALAAMPDVTKLAEADGNVVLRISVPAPPANKFPGGKLPAGVGEIKLFINAATLTLHAWSDYTGTTTILAARWTNTLPRIIPDSQLASPKS